MDQSLTESILSLFIFQDVYVVSFLVAGIMVLILLLLMYNFKTPESVVLKEIQDSENIEGALRRVLGEKAWVTSSESGGESSGDALKQIGGLEQEVLSKDKEIADLHKQLTQGGSGEGGSGNDAELNSKIDELEARLLEYEIIEDDIADLSLYKAENEKLKTELASLRGGGAPEPAPAPAPAPEPVAEEPASEPIPEPVAEEPVVEAAPEPEPVPFAEDDDNDTEANGRDLVAEFEKVVNNKDAIFGDEESIEIDTSDDSQGDGDVLLKVAEEQSVVQEIEEAPIEHPSLENVKPDSKEEADVFISDLKSIKKGS